MQGQVTPPASAGAAPPAPGQSQVDPKFRTFSPLPPLSSLPESNANLIYDVCTEEMTLERPFKSSCHCRSPCRGSLLISTPCFIKAKSLFPAREQLLNRVSPRTVEVLSVGCQGTDTLRPESEVPSTCCPWHSSLGWIPGPSTHVSQLEERSWDLLGGEHRSRLLK